MGSIFFPMNIQMSKDISLKDISLPTRRLYNACLRMQENMGGFWWWLTSWLNSDDDRVLLEVKEELHQFMNPSKHDSMYLHRMDQNQTIIKKMEAYVEGNVHVVSLYLMAKHRKDCTPLSKDSSDNNQLQWTGLWPDHLLDFNAPSDGVFGVFHPSLNVKSTKLQTFKDAWDRMACNTTDRFIFIFLTLSTGVEDDWRGHQNVLIYDVEKKELERFEPHGGGSSVSIWCIEEYKTNPLVLQLQNAPCTEDSIDNAIVKHLKPIIGFNTYYPPMSFCPIIGFQSKKSFEKEGVDPGGFCFYWSIYYVDLRLSFPNKTRTQVIKDAMAGIEDMFDVHEWDDFGSFIRSYAVFIEMFVKIVNGRKLEGEALVAFINELIEEFTAKNN